MGQVPVERTLLQVRDSLSYGSVNVYKVTADSLWITAVSDYGRMPVLYLRRELTDAERQRVDSFLGSLHLDSLEDAYLGDDARVREITVQGTTGMRTFATRMTGCYSMAVASFCTFINGLVPEEAAIRLRREDYSVIR